MPADTRVVTSIRLHVEQAILTGEPGSEIKLSSPLPEDTPLADRHNVLYAGTTVTEGRGYGVVVATGVDTEIGKIAKDVSEAGEAKPPLQRKISKLAVQLSAAAAMACAILYWPFLGELGFTSRLCSLWPLLFQRGNSR